jgi:hypothetical protein
MSRSPTIAYFVLVSALCVSFVSGAPASAQERGVTVKNCIGGYYRGFTCVTTARRGDLNPHIIGVPQPISEQERAEMQQRDRQWQARCRPVVRQDDYGVARYSYAARGCEFGKLD